MVQVYLHLEEFPRKLEQHNYYKMLANRVALTIKPVTQFLIARTLDCKIKRGNIVYKQVRECYGGMVPILNASRFRFLL